MTYLGDETPVQRKAKPAFEYMMTLVREIEAMPDEATARDALRAYIAVRKRLAPSYAPRVGGTIITREGLVAAIKSFVDENSEGGKRAQAVVAGLLDVTFGAKLVVTDRINSPSRRYPGDVCVLVEAEGDIFQKAFEVKDKPVTVTDVQIFGRKCLDFAVREAAYVMVAAGQTSLDESALHAWAADAGLGLTFFRQWSPLVSQCLFWGPLPSPDGAIEAALSIRERLIAIEVSPSSIDRWDSLVGVTGEMGN